MYEIQNENIRIGINPKGAELEYFYINDINILWTRKDDVWKFQAPVLFPIIGALKDGYYIYNENSYKLNRHGFARNSIFVLENITKDEITLSLTFNETTLEVYPFKFKLEVNYKINNYLLEVSYNVINLDEKPIPFNIGYHPGLLLNGLKDLLGGELKLDIDLNKSNEVLFSSGYINEIRKNHSLNYDSIVMLNEDLKNKDTICLDGIKKVDIYDKHHLSIEHNMSYTGFWQANDDFICIEPWEGLPDENIKKSFNIFDKLAIKVLMVNQNYSTKIKIEYKE